MKTVVCLELPDVNTRFAKVCDLPLEPSVLLVIRVHVGDKVWTGTVDEIEVSTSSSMLVAYVEFSEEPGAKRGLLGDLQQDKSWHQFGDQDLEGRDCPEGPLESDCIEMLAVP